MTSVLLGRHAFAEHNRDHYFAGGRIDTDLTPEGQAEAAVRGAILAESKQIDVIICSPMKRARQTAEIISHVYTKKTGKELPIVKSELLREVDMGVFTGLNNEQATALNKQAIDDFIQNNLIAWNFPEGESYADIHFRIQILPRTLHKFAGKSILIIAHGTLNRCIEEYYGIEVEENFDHSRIVSCQGLAEMI